MSDTQTPRTDHEIGRCHFYPPEGFIDFARTLERENQQLREMTVKHLEQYGEHWGECQLSKEYNPQVRCSCGFDAALAAYQSLSQGGKG